MLPITDLKMLGAADEGLGGNGKARRSLGATSGLLLPVGLRNNSKERELYPWQESSKDLKLDPTFWKVSDPDHHVLHPVLVMGPAQD